MANLTKQEALQALNNSQFVGFTTATGNVIVKKSNRTNYDIFVYEDGNDEPSHYIGKITNVLATFNDKKSNKDFVIVEK
ncbi:hypothetical protein LZ480_05730 [Solibacillus sp. MA9]|uniref:Uncharacterized protein n=1 Tax=Solibacillus palustris TaxID=2908203 RepID=A0ABS9UAZ6_9BACL|nr:hypothetical protein [Solibacillus sp. MA9]MCH7321388.1 hypothetical protein [Solibacillus sp. MA9]